MQQKRGTGVTLFQQDSELPNVTGEGITRTSDPEAGFYWVEALFRGSCPLHSCIRANSSSQAVAFCRARHPTAYLVRLMEGQ